MRVKSIYLENVRGLPSIALDFFDPVTGQIRPRTVIAGSNGTGKTTVLDTIYFLMNMMVTKPEFALEKWLSPGQVQVKLELVDLPTLSHSTLDYTYPAGWSLTIALGPKSWLSQIDAPDRIFITGDALYNWRYVHHDEPDSVLSLDWPIQREWMEAERPSTLYFPSEQRELAVKEKGQIVAEGREHEWVWRFSDSQKWSGSLESFLVAMDYRDLMAQRERQTDAGEFQPFLQVINRFLQGKQIVGVAQKSFRVQVRADDGQEFGVDQLSSGEKQILLMLGEIQRRISKGSIVLIDEPEIHLHPRWQRLLVRTLTDLCALHDAQLIITTHSEEIASAVYEHELLLLDAVFEPEPMT
jgi:predicted ATPase